MHRLLAPYRAVVPEERHAAAGKEGGLTNHVERFWLTVRQRAVRPQAPVLLQVLLEPSGALWDFIRHYYTSLL